MESEDVYSLAVVFAGSPRRAGPDVRAGERRSSSAEIDAVGDPSGAAATMAARPLATKVSTPTLSAAAPAIFNLAIIMDRSA